MASTARDTVLVLLLGVPDGHVEPGLDVAPDISIEITVCPHCFNDNCEVWDSEEARMATCPECNAQFIPDVNESVPKRALDRLFDGRQKIKSLFL